MRYSKKNDIHVFTWEIQEEKRKNLKKVVLNDLKKIILKEIIFIRGQKILTVCYVCYHTNKQIVELLCFKFFNWCKIFVLFMKSFSICLIRFMKQIHVVTSYRGAYLDVATHSDQKVNLWWSTNPIITYILLFSFGAGVGGFKD